MMSADQLHQVCLDLRYSETITLTDAIIDQIESDVQEYRDRFLVEPKPQLPPEPLRELLPLMGWLIYEASWDAVQRVEAAFELLEESRRADSEVAYRQVRRVANCARALVWPEYAPRALGAIRAQALA
jgi:hypothetical protein